MTKVKSSWTLTQGWVNPEARQLKCLVASRGLLWIEDCCGRLPRADRRRRMAGPDLYESVARTARRSRAERFMRRK